MDTALWAILGVFLGAGFALAVIALLRRSRVSLTERLLEQAKIEKEKELGTILEQLKTSFAALSREALSANTDDFLKTAQLRLEKQTAAGEQALEGKKKLIDARLEEMQTRLTSLNDLIQRVDKQRAESFGMVAGQLEKATQATHRLQDTTGQLREALSNPQRRGQWGERMAEDVLRLVGFVEGVNYHKQKRLADGTIPDFTFLLPSNQCVHMDVKFPLANYLKMLDAAEESAELSYRNQFLKDVRSRVKEVTSRAYIDPAAGTVDYMLVFIPNEQIYSFIHEHDAGLLDYALQNKVVLCSPLTLYAILAVIRQAAANYRLHLASRQILELLAAFKKQWDKFVEGMDRMGDRLESATREFEKLKGVRTRTLERQLDRVEDLRSLEQQLDTAQPAPSDDGAASDPSLDNA